MWYDYISVLHNSYNPVYYYKTNTRPFHFYFLEFSKITHFGYERLLGIFKHQFCYVYLTVLSWPKVQISLLSSTPKLKNRASSRLLAKNRVSQVFWDLIKNSVSPRSVLLKAVYLEALLYSFRLKSSKITVCIWTVQGVFFSWILFGYLDHLDRL